MSAPVMTGFFRSVGAGIVIWALRRKFGGFLSIDLRNRGLWMPRTLPGVKTIALGGKKVEPRFATSRPDFLSEL